MTKEVRALALSLVLGAAMAFAGPAYAGTGTPSETDPCIIEGLGVPNESVQGAFYLYRPSLLLTPAGLEIADTATVAGMIERFETLAVAAAGNPGNWEDGNIALGANPREYVPSDEELMLALYAGQLHEFLLAHSRDHLLDENGGRGWQSTYARFEIRHVDVMGTGRFFYASAPIPTHISLPPQTP